MTKNIRAAGNNEKDYGLSRLPEERLANFLIFL
jgi:hypothetical protein